MKKIKICMAAVLVMSLLVLTACGRSDNNKQASTQSTTSAGSGGNETSGTSGTGSGANETGANGSGTNKSTGSGESTGYGADDTAGSGSGDGSQGSRGVLDDMADDIEEGVDDLMDGPGTATRASDES